MSWGKSGKGQELMKIWSISWPKGFSQSKKKHPGANATSKFKLYPALARKPKLWGWIRYVCLSGARYKRERHLFVILILLQDIASHPKCLNLCHKSLCYLQVSAWILKTSLCVTCGEQKCLTLRKFSAFCHVVPCPKEISGVLSGWYKHYGFLCFFCLIILRRIRDKRGQKIIKWPTALSVCPHEHFNLRTEMLIGIILNDILHQGKIAIQRLTWITTFDRILRFSEPTTNCKGFKLQGYF